MNWIRANIKQGSQLALLALALQILMSFGHFHAVDAPSNQFLFHATPLESAESSSGVDWLSVKPLPVSRHDSGRQPYDQCAICAVMAMAHALTIAAAPMLLLPPAFDCFYRIVGAGLIHARSGRVAFQPRAPPFS
jgi:hypothetical protein